MVQESCLSLSAFRGEELPCTTSISDTSVQLRPISIESARDYSNRV